MNDFEELFKKPEVEESDEKASTGLGTGSSDSSTTDLIKNGGCMQDADGNVVKYSRGLGSFFPTIGLMSVVLIIALDNYIIGMNLLLFLVLH